MGSHMSIVYVTLTAEEMDLAMRIGRDIQATNDRLGIVDRQITTTNPAHQHGIAKAAELAVCKWAGLPYETVTQVADLDNFHKAAQRPDTPLGDIKSTNRPNGNLAIAAYSYHPNWRYILVRTHQTPTYHIVGWAYGSMVPTDGGRFKTPGYLLHANKLQPPQTLQNLEPICM